MSDTTIPNSSPFQVIGDHDGVNTESYKCLLNNETDKILPFSEAFSNGAVTIPYPDGLPKGSYLIDVIAISPDDEESESDPNNECNLIVSGKKPKSVINVRIEVQ